MLPYFRVISFLNGVYNQKNKSAAFYFVNASFYNKKTILNKTPFNIELTSYDLISKN